MPTLIENGHLEIRDPVSGQLVWRGPVSAAAVLEAFPLPGTPDCVVVLDSMTWGSESNIIRLDPQGTIVWRSAPAPVFGDYVRAAMEDGALTAWSSSGYMVRLNPESGTIVESHFVK